MSARRSRVIPSATVGHALVTGGAGFIGSHLVDRLLADNWRVTVLDNFDSFYDVGIKRRNVAPHLLHPHYTLMDGDVRDESCLARLAGGYDVVVHLAARAGVRPSIEQPLLYNSVNVSGTQALLERCRAWRVQHFVFASSSSVYGVNPRVPWREDDSVLLPISPYASTKVSGELLGHVYSHLYGIRFVALRFFTVYGPRQRPDLAIHKFARLMLRGEPVPLYGSLDSRRDYTYVADVVSGIVAAMHLTSSPFEIINLGNDSPVSLGELLSALQEALQTRAIPSYGPPQAGDVPQTWADIGKARRLLGYRPSTSLADGLTAFADWIGDGRLTASTVA